MWEKKNKEWIFLGGGGLKYFFNNGFVWWSQGVPQETPLGHFVLLLISISYDQHRKTQCMLVLGLAVFDSRFANAQKGNVTGRSWTDLLYIANSPLAAINIYLHTVPQHWFFFSTSMVTAGEKIKADCNHCLLVNFSYLTCFIKVFTHTRSLKMQLFLSPVILVLFF